MLDHEDIETEQTESQYKVSPYRWVVLTVFSLASFAVGNMITSFSTTAPIT